MKLLSALLLAACALPAPARAQADPLAAAAWLAGCWTQPGHEPGSVEQWMAPAGGLMLGMARTLRPGRAAQFEFMQIRVGGDGRLSYIAQPQGRPATEFGLLRQGEDELVFENPSHDFPQRVIYRRAGPDRLAARIEGNMGGQPRGIDFALQRGSCP